MAYRDGKRRRPKTALKGKASFYLMEVFSKVIAILRHPALAGDGIGVH
jgi:hypothetical protein